MRGRRSLSNQNKEQLKLKQFTMGQLCECWVQELISGAHHALLQGDRVPPKLIDSVTEALLEVSALHN